MCFSVRQPPVINGDCSVLMHGDASAIIDSEEFIYRPDRNIGLSCNVSGSPITRFCRRQDVSIYCN